MLRPWRAVGSQIGTRYAWNEGLGLPFIVSRPVWNVLQYRKLPLGSPALGGLSKSRNWLSCRTKGIRQVMYSPRSIHAACWAVVVVTYGLGGLLFSPHSVR